MTFSHLIRLMPTTAVMHITAPHKIVDRSPGSGMPNVLRIPANASPQSAAWNPNQQIKQNDIIAEMT